MFEFINVQVRKKESFDSPCRAQPLSACVIVACLNSHE